MAEIVEFKYAVPFIFFVLMAFLIMFLILIYPSERANILGENEGQMIEIRDQRFVPETITVPAGTTISWINMDNVKHRVVGLGFSSQVLNPGDSYSYRFDETGVHTYSCEFYPAMRGQIIVT